jgi:hypothetical protein
MKKFLPILFLLFVFMLSTIGSEFIKPFTSYFTQKIVDEDNPFNFKNEYELLIWSNKQKETQETIKNITNLVDANDKDAFANCVIEKNLASLEELNLNDSKLNPIQPKTVEELGTALKEYQPLMIEVQTKSVKACSPQEEADTRPEITLACTCTNVQLLSPIARSLEYECGISPFESVKGVAINFQRKKFNFGDRIFDLMEDENFYYGIDLGTRLEVASRLTDEQIAYFKENPKVANLQQIQNASIKLERLTGSLEYNIFWGWGDGDEYLSTFGGPSFTPSMTGTSQCRLAERF